jgi:hypothetical protein
VRIITAETEKCSRKTFRRKSGTWLPVICPPQTCLSELDRPIQTPLVNICLFAICKRNSWPRFPAIEVLGHSMSEFCLSGKLITSQFDQRHQMDVRLYRVFKPLINISMPMECEEV